MSQQATSRAKFHPGQVVATPGALEAIRASGQSPEVFLGAHLEGLLGRRTLRGGPPPQRRGPDRRLPAAVGVQDAAGRAALDHHRGRRRRRASARTTILLPEEY